MSRGFKMSLAAIVSFMWLLSGSASFAKDGVEKYLITMPGPEAAIAKSWKSLGEGKYEFTIDSTKKIKKGEVSFNTLKKSLERKSIITKVTGDASKIVVEYKGDEATFLKKIAKTRIKDYGSDVDIALESSVSDGGIRARTSSRAPAPGEVKAKIVGKKGSDLRVMVMKKGPSGVPDIPMMRPIYVNPKGYKTKPGQVIFFKPKAKKGKTWEGTDFKDK